MLTASTPTTDEAVKKFGNAKSISSEQFFGNTMDCDVRFVYIWSALFS